MSGGKTRDRFHSRIFALGGAQHADFDLRELGNSDSVRRNRPLLTSIIGLRTEARYTAAKSCFCQARRLEAQLVITASLLRADEGVAPQGEQGHAYYEQYDNC
jgi:hypothetical protein